MESPVLSCPFANLFLVSDIQLQCSQVLSWPHSFTFLIFGTVNIATSKASVSAELGEKKDTQTKHKVKILVFDLLVVSATLTRWQTKQTFQLMLSVSHPEKKNCERTSSCLQCPARTMSCLCVLLSRVALLELVLKGCHPWAFVPSRQGRSSVVLRSSACVGGCAQCHVRCHPATHMVSDLALWVCPTTNGNSIARVPVLFRVVLCDRSCQEGSFGLRKPFGVNGLLWRGLFFGFFFCSGHGGFVLWLWTERQGFFFIAEKQSHRYLYLFFLDKWFYSCCLKMDRKQNIGSSQPLQKLHLDLAALPLGCEGMYT